MRASAVRLALKKGGLRDACSPFHNVYRPCFGWNIGIYAAAGKGIGATYGSAYCYP